MEKRIMHNHSPEELKELCEYFRRHSIIGKYMPANNDDFIIQIVFEMRRCDHSDWYLTIVDYTKKVTTEFHICENDNGLCCLGMRQKEHSIFKRWTLWTEVKP